eukprot:11172213-Lingulodinium_polyedra.AAC.1
MFTQHVRGACKQCKHQTCSRDTDMLTQHARARCAHGMQTPDMLTQHRHARADARHAVMMH